MALISNLNETAFGIPVENAYTFITELEIIKQPMFKAPEIEGDSPVLISSHQIRFRTESYASKTAKESGQSPVAGHGYTIPFEYETNSNILEFSYNWLKSNVGIFTDAVND